MGLGIVDRSLRTTAVLLLVTIPFLLYYFGVWPTLAFLSGGVWGILNLWLLAHLIRFTIKSGGIDKRRALGVALYKFPVLYLAGFFLLRVDRFDPLIVLAGSTSTLAVMILKAVGRLMLGLDLSSAETRNLQGVK